MKSIIRFYRALYNHYNKVAVTAGNKTLIRQPDGSYRPAGWKGQILGLVVVNAYIGGLLYAYYHYGRKQGRMEGHHEGRCEVLFEMDEETYDRYVASTGQAS